jgi:hypothetical protein
MAGLDGQLPPDLVHRVLGECDGRELSRCAQVCRARGRCCLSVMPTLQVVLTSITCHGRPMKVCCVFH